MVTQETIIYRLVGGNHVFDAFLKEILFLAGKWAWAPRGLVPKDPTKKLAQWLDLLVQPLSRKHVFEIFGPEPSPPAANKLPNLKLPINFYK